MKNKAKILKFIDSIALSKQGKQIIKKLLLLRQLALKNNNIKLLTKVNKQLFQINQLYRRKLTNKALSKGLDYENAKTFEFITCYRLI